MKLYSMYKGTWFFLVLFCAALLLGGPAHSLLEDHGGEVVTHCDGHTPLEHLEGAEGDHDILLTGLVKLLAKDLVVGTTIVPVQFLGQSPGFHVTTGRQPGEIQQLQHFTWQNVANPRDGPGGSAVHEAMKYLCIHADHQ